MDATNNIATDLFYKVRSRFTGLKLGNNTGAITINPEEARFFDFDYMEGATAIGHVTISLAEQNSLKVYFSTGISESMDSMQKNNWYGFLKELRQFAKRRLMSFDTRDIAKDNLEKQDFKFLSQHNQPKELPNTFTKAVGESIMSESSLYGTKTMSFQKLMDTRLIIKHSHALNDDTAPGARSRNIAGLFVENELGERFKYPFIHLEGARAMQRHVANSGLPYDDIGKSIIGMSEQIAQLKSFGNYVNRNDLMNSSTNEIVERSTVALQAVREQLHKITKQKHYEAYKESFQAQAPLEVPQDVVEDYTEKFTVRNFKEDIKSVFPVLYRLMKESEIGYDDIVAMTTQEEIVGEETEVAPDEFDQFESWVMELGSHIGARPVSEADAPKTKPKWGTTWKGFDKTSKDYGAEDPHQVPRNFKWTKDAAGKHVADNPEEHEKWSAEYDRRMKSPEYQAYHKDQMAHIDAQSKAYKAHKARNGKFDTELEIANPYFDPNDQSDEDTPEEIDVGVDYTAETTGDYMPATWGYHGGEPEEYAEEEITIHRVVDLDTGEDITDKVDLEKIEQQISGETGHDPYSTRKSRGRDESIEQEAINPKNPRDYERPTVDRNKDGQPPLRMQDVKAKDTEHKRNFDARLGGDRPQKESSDMNVQEVAEFIHSFYDRESGTFPKGPEGVATMVGKKFGEQAEHVARKMVERMAPQQQDNSMNELARIKQLSGM